MKLNINESQNIEFKESWNDKYLEWICGFANAQGGSIFIGVNDAHEVIGLSDSKRLMEDIPNKIVSHLGIVCDVDLHSANELDYIAIKVEPSNVPISYRGHYHYRSGSTKQELTGTALQQFVLKKLNISWDSSVQPYATLDDIDEKAVQYFVRKAVKEGRIPASCSDDSVELILQRLHLLSQTGELTMAALLLFGKDIEKWSPTSIFRIGRFGVDNADLILNDDIICPLIMMPDRIIEILRSRYLVSPIHYVGLDRREPLEIPVEGLREMLCNAIIHKDYQSTYIQMKVWNDHITLWNPGELPSQLTIDQLLGDHESYPRNGLIARVFYLAGFIEAWGRGYTKICDNFKKENLQIPTFEQLRGGIMVTIEREIFKAINVGRNELANNLPNETIQVNMQVKELIISIRDKSLTKMELLKLGKLTCKSRKTLEDNYINPAIEQGWVAMEYPQTPRHPRQKYKLTEKGLSVLESIKNG